MGENGHASPPYAIICPTLAGPFLVRQQHIAIAKSFPSSVGETDGL